MPCRYLSRPAGSIPPEKPLPASRARGCVGPRVASRHQEALVKGLGWPQHYRPGGAAGLGWPRNPQLFDHGSVNGQSAPAGCHSVTGQAIVTALRQDTRHVIGAVLSPTRGFTGNGGHATGSAMLGWDGAAPEVTDEGLSWPRLTPVSRESDASAAAMVRPRTP